MQVILNDDQAKLIKTIAQENGFTNFEVDSIPGTIKGDNYMGVITRVTVKNDDRQMNLILKSASPNENYRKVSPVHDIFIREMHIYENVFQEFTKFQEEYNISDPFLGFAKFHGKCDKEGSECFVMENLLEKGYRMWERKRPMDVEHIEAVMVEYAKFHAVSLAMNEKKPELFKGLTKTIEKHVFETQNASMDDDEKERMMKGFVKAITANGYAALKDNLLATEAFRKFESSMIEMFINDVKKTEFDIVITHGDNWCNNLMFQYEDSENPKKPSKVCILDWQISKKGSPAADLTYFFLAHSPKEVLYDYKTYLKLYHDTVSKNLREFSCDPEQVFPYSLLEHHWNEFIKFGFYMSLMIIKIMCCDTDEAPDLVDDVDSGKDVMESFSFELRNIDEFNRRIRDIMEFLMDNNFI